MEPRAQLLKWQGQIAAADEDATADMDVAKRLLTHGIEALDEINALRAENASLRQDSDRLDFLERSHEGVYVCMHEELIAVTDGTNRRVRSSVFDGWGCGAILAQEQPTVRAAIDAAMRKGG